VSTARYYPVQGAHLSSKWNRPRWTLKRQLRRAEKRGATWLTLTEVADGKRPEAVKLPGWSKAHQTDPAQPFDLGECAILVKDSEWAIIRWRTYVIGPDLGPGNRIVMTIALLRHRLTGGTLLLSTSHMPSGIEGAWQGRRARHYRQALDRWRRINLAWRRAFKPDNEATVADWNLNFHQQWVRAFFRGAWPGLEEPHSLPKGGTHGPRLIDMIRTRGWVNAVRVTIRSSRGASDHRELWVYGWIRYRTAR
jgi:hypothetical protein